MRAMRATWDIFCNVIDNYGDIGIAWRLARGLVKEHHLAVRLWVDDLHAFQRIWPAVAVGVDQQVCEGVRICAWHTPFADTEPAQVVVEAFGCALPESYLSAEAWVAEHHGLPSPHPRLPLTKYFFFPGYTPDTGGLLVEADWAAKRASFLATSVPEFWRQHGLGMPVPDELRVSLFAYENPALPALLDAWAADSRSVTCLVPEGRVIPQLAAWLAVPVLKAGDVHQRGSLQLHILPFTNQDAYDHLLWACHLNFVRGEDSCVRAQWAARPLVWQAYPQAEKAHWAKYTDGMASAPAHAVCELWRSWNGMADPVEIAAGWAGWRAQQAAIERHAVAWCDRLKRAGRLTDKLVEFAENKLK